MDQDPIEDQDQGDPLNPQDNEPSGLDDLTHAEFLAIYNDASMNIRFAKEQQWRAVLYFMFGGIAASAFGIMTRWSDTRLVWFLFGTILLFSVGTVFVILCLQWWQNAEHRKIDYVTSKWSSFATAARNQKSKKSSEVQRYFLLFAMILFLELMTLAIARIFISAIP